MEGPNKEAKTDEREYPVEYLKLRALWRAIWKHDIVEAT